MSESKFKAKLETLGFTHFPEIGGLPILKELEAKSAQARPKATSVADKLLFHKIQIGGFPRLIVVMDETGQLWFLAGNLDLMHDPDFVDISVWNTSEQRPN